MFVDVLKTSTRGPGWMFRCWIHFADFIRRIKVVVDRPTYRCDLMLIQLLTQCVSICFKPACCTGDEDGNDWGRRWSVSITSLWANNNSKVVTVIFGGRYCNITVIMCVICYTACHWGQKYQHCTVILWTRYCWTHVGFFSITKTLLSLSWQYLVLTEILIIWFPLQLPRCHWKEQRVTHTCSVRQTSKEPQ